MSKRLKIIVGLVAILLVGIAIFAFSQSKENQVVAAKRGEMIEAIYALGKVKARKQFELKVGILSTVEKVYVKEGDHVAKGAPLIKLTDSGVFKAPYAGMVTLVAVEEGEPAIANSPVLRVDDYSDLFIEVSLEQQGALRVQKDQQAEIIFESLRGEKMKGKVSALFSKNDEFLAHIQVVGGFKSNVLPGMTADVAIVIGRHENALLIPANSISNGYVILLRDGKRKKVAVKIGGLDGQMAEVIDGDILENDQIVVGRNK